MAVFRSRDLHLAKKAIGIAELAIERQPRQFQPFQDQADVRALIDALIQNDVELEHHAHSAKLVVTGEPY